MDNIFENKFTRDKEWAKDTFGYIYFHRPMKKIFDVFFAMSWFFGFMSIIVINDNIEWFLLVAPVIWWAFTLFSYSKSINTSLKRDLELHGKAIEVITVATDDMIKYSQATGSEFQLSYSDIKRVVQTKRFIYLWSKTNILYTFKKDSFTVGCHEDFLLFLKKKGIKVK